MLERDQEGADQRCQFDRDPVEASAVHHRCDQRGQREAGEALAMVATMVGALTLACAVDDPELSDRILAAARTRLASR